jgi:hypothetical protein
MNKDTIKEFLEHFLLKIFEVLKYAKNEFSANCKLSSSLWARSYDFLDKLFCVLKMILFRFDLK